MQRFKNILLFLQTSHLSDPAAIKAIALAKSNNARLYVIDVLNVSPFGKGVQSFSQKIENLQQQVQLGRQRELEVLTEEIAQDIDVHTAVLTGKDFIEIIRFVQENLCDLVIKTVETDNRLSSILFGSADQRLLRKCPCPVWVVKSVEDQNIGRVLAAVQLEKLSEKDQLDALNQQIVEIAASLALRESSQLNIVNAWLIFGGEPLANKLSKHYKEDVSAWMAEQKQTIEDNQSRFLRLFDTYRSSQEYKNLECRFHFIEGEAEDVIVDLAERENIDLVVMGTVARTDLAGFFVGNTCEAVLHRLNCSILAVKPPGFISPVTLDNAR